MAKEKASKKPVKEPDKIIDMPQSASGASFIRKKRISLIVGLTAVIAVLGLLYYYRGLFVVAIVNGQPISRIAVIKDLEKLGGSQTLNSHVTKLLILQEAKKKNISVSQNEMDAEIKKNEASLKKQKQSLDEALLSRGMTKNELLDQIRMQKIIEKLMGNDVKVTEKEIADYIEQNKAILEKEQDESALKAQVSDELKQQKLNAKFQSWLENVQKNAKITYFVSY